MADLKHDKKPERRKSPAQTASAILLLLFFVLTIAVTLAQGDRGVLGKTGFTLMAAGRFIACGACTAALVLALSERKKGRMTVTECAIFICALVWSALNCADYIYDIFAGRTEISAQEWRITGLRDKDAYDAAEPELSFTDAQGRIFYVPISYELGEAIRREMNSGTYNELYVSFYPATRIIEDIGLCSVETQHK